MGDQHPNPLYDTIFEMPVGIYFLFSGESGYHFPSSYAEEELYVLNITEDKG
jgi:hypothetical protein